MSRQKSLVNIMLSSQQFSKFLMKTLIAAFIIHLLLNRSATDCTGWPRWLVHTETVYVSVVAPPTFVLCFLQKILPPKCGFLSRAYVESSS